MCFGLGRGNHCPPATYKVEISLLLFVFLVNPLPSANAATSDQCRSISGINEGPQESNASSDILVYPSKLYSGGMYGSQSMQISLLLGDILGLTRKN